MEFGVVIEGVCLLPLIHEENCNQLVITHLFLSRMLTVTTTYFMAERIFLYSCDVY